MELKYKVGKTTLDRLKGVDTKLVIVFTTYLNMNKKDIGCTYGARTEEAQAEFLKTGKTTVKKSKHMPFKEVVNTPDGFKMDIVEFNAIDIVAYKEGKQVWERAYYEDIIKDMKAIVKHFGWQDLFNWGWDFVSLNDPYHISVKEIGDGGIK